MRKYSLIFSSYYCFFPWVSVQELKFWEEYWLSNQTTEQTRPLALGSMREILRRREEIPKVCVWTGRLSQFMLQVAQAENIPMKHSNHLRAGLEYKLLLKSYGTLWFYIQKTTVYRRQNRSCDLNLTGLIDCERKTQNSPENVNDFKSLAT